jgi:hypothetical protein
MTIENIRAKARELMHSNEGKIPAPKVRVTVVSDAKKPR